MDSATAGFLGAIIGGTIGVAGTYFTATKMFHEQRFDAAATKFRSMIIAAFKEIVLAANEPTHYGTSDPKVAKNTTEINIEAFEFQFFAENKNDFEKSTKAYTQFCEKIKEDNYWYFDAKLFAEFQCCVEHFVSYTEKKSLAANLRDKLDRLPDTIKKLKQCKF